MLLMMAASASARPNTAQEEMAQVANNWRIAGTPEQKTIANLSADNDNAGLLAQHPSVLAAQQAETKADHYAHALQNPHTPDAQATLTTIDLAKTVAGSTSDGAARPFATAANPSLGFRPLSLEQLANNDNKPDLRLAREPGMSGDQRYANRAQYPAPGMTA
jgi:hypothetical protein